MRVWLNYYLLPHPRPHSHPPALSFPSLLPGFRPAVLRITSSFPHIHLIFFQNSPLFHAISTRQALQHCQCTLPISTKSPPSPFPSLLNFSPPPYPPPLPFQRPAPSRAVTHWNTRKRVSAFTPHRLSLVSRERRRVLEVGVWRDSGGGRFEGTLGRGVWGWGV